MPRTTTNEPARPAGERALLSVPMPPERIITPVTVELARGDRTFTWHRGDPDITLFEGDVATYGSLRLAVTAYTADAGGLELKLAETANPRQPTILLESDSEQNYQQLRTVVTTPGRRVRLYVWMDECPSGQVEVTWGVWGRST